eukprot:TRINITY_DN844_c0_g1_i1.p1 TRINITY_DN844_c0_g1~~TRINITY_DN844_c0_g1_i1.p1  ORF type:complete len:1775 (-),score=219.69 TRINITY_DN844_c0_g1_i1:792-6116(-)
MATSNPTGHNEMAALVAEAHGVERIEALTAHGSPEVRSRARLILERVFGTEPSNLEDIQPQSFMSPATSLHIAQTSASPQASSLVGHMQCSCGISPSRAQNDKVPPPVHYQQAEGTFGLNGENSLCRDPLDTYSQISHGLGPPRLGETRSGADIINSQDSTSGSSTDSDPDDDDSDSDLLPPPPAPCHCLLCSNTSPLAERRPRGKGLPSDDMEPCQRSAPATNAGIRSICSFCSGGGRLGDGRAGLAAKLGRAVRLGHSHCLAIILSRMNWSQRMAATEAPALLHPGGGPPDGGVGSSLPAFILAAQLGKPSCLSLLLKRCQPNMDLTYGKKRLTALAWASHKGYLRCCQLLLEYGAIPATRCGDAVTALHLAASGGGNPAVCRLLIDHKAPVNAKSAKKQTPLCLAARKGYSRIVQILLDCGADPNNHDEGKYTPLHLAASSGYLETVNILLRSGSYVDAATRNEITPLHYAVQGGHSQVVQALISSGANVNCSKKPLLLIAADDGKLDIVNLLLNAGASITCRANIRAVLGKEAEVCDYLTPLHLAASKNHYEVVDALIRRGAEVNELTPKSRWSALDFAVLNGHSESATILLQHGATVSDTCKSIGRNNWTLVQHAASNGAKDVVRLLILRIKEQSESLASSVDVDTASNLIRLPIQKISTHDPLADPPGSNGMMTSSYSVNENVHHTCTACSKLRQASCIDQTSLNTSVSANVSGRDRNVHELRRKDKDDRLPNMSVHSGITSTEAESKHQLSRRNVIIDGRKNTMREREIKKRETEAREARGRLEEAISQRSVTKLTEAISHVSKLVLHLAASVGCDTPSDHFEHEDPVGHNKYSDGYHYSEHGHASKQKYGSSNSLIPAPLAMEVGLGNEVQKARKILASLLAEEKRIREEKEKEALDMKRENAQQLLRKTISVTLGGGDPRSLSRAVNRVTKSILDMENSFVIEATKVSTLLSELEKQEQAMGTAIESEDVEKLKESISKIKNCVTALTGIGGARAISRVFRGREAEDVVANAEVVLTSLREKREREEAEQLRAIVQEREVGKELQEAMNSDDMSRLEVTIARACEVLISKQSALANTIEAAKKVRARRLKIERRKLRQAINTNDPSRIIAAASLAEMFGLSALRQDVVAAKAHAKKLAEQAVAVEDLKQAMARADVSSLTMLRAKLNSLGMFTEAETARSEVERLQRASRAGTLLEAAVQECNALCEHLKLALVEFKSVDEILTKLGSWTWPDVQRLNHLSDRARRHGSLHNSLCDTADLLSKELVSVSRKLLELCLESNDARAIAATITAFESTFRAVIISKQIDCKGCEMAVAAAKQHLSHVQAMDQASVKAESAQVKVEYALATSRRSIVRNRQGKGVIVPRLIGQTRDGNPDSHQSETSLSGDSRICSSQSSVELMEADVQESRTVSRKEKHVLPNQTSLDCRESCTTSTTKFGLKTQVKDDCRFRESLDNSPIISGECSHFYLFKEGNIVCCARCGNRRNSNNPEWLARVKRRGSTIPQDGIADWSGPLTSSELADKEANMRKLYSSGRSASIDVMEDSGSVDQSFCNARLPLAQTSAQGFTPVRISSVETTHSASMSDVMMQMLQEHTSNQVTQAGVSHRLRGGGQQGSTASNVMSRIPNMFHNMTRTVPSLQPSIQVSGSETSSSPFSQSILSIPNRLSAQHRPVGTYRVTGNLMPPDTGSSQAPNRSRSPLRRQGLHMDRNLGSRLSLRHENEIRAGLQESTSEDMAEVGRDLGTDFANENFGFDIDAIIDEPAPLQ